MLLLCVCRFLCMAIIYYIYDLSKTSVTMSTVNMGPFGLKNIIMWSRKNAATRLVADSSKSSNSLGRRFVKIQQLIWFSLVSCWILTNGDQFSYWILTNWRPSELLHFSETTSCN